MMEVYSFNSIHKKIYPGVSGLASNLVDQIEILGYKVSLLNHTQKVDKKLIILEHTFYSISFLTFAYSAIIPKNCFGDFCR